jgi:hypothetical protein
LDCDELKEKGSDPRLIKQDLLKQMGELQVQLIVEQQHRYITQVHHTGTDHSGTAAPLHHTCTSHSYIQQVQLIVKQQHSYITQVRIIGLLLSGQRMVQYMYWTVLDVKICPAPWKYNLVEFCFTGYTGTKPNMFIMDVSDNIL